MRPNHRLGVDDKPGHEAFTDLAPRTRSDYQAVFNYLKPVDDTPLSRFDRPLIVRIRDKRRKIKAANLLTM